MKPYNGDKPYIFISYAHKNINRVMSIVERMNIDGYRMWYDEGIDPGNEWADNIATKISNSTCLIAMISADYLKSENCKDEISYARENDVRILLLYIEDVQLSGGLALRNHRMQLNILVSGNLDSRILETDIPEEGNSLIGLFTTYQVVRYCQAQSRFAVL